MGAMLIRFTGDPMAARQAIEQKWKQLAPDVPFVAEFSDDIVAELYEAGDARARRSSPPSPCSR